MIPKTLPEQEDHLFAVLRGERFLQMEGLGNEAVSYTHLTLPTSDLV